MTSAAARCFARGAALFAFVLFAVVTTAAATPAASAAPAAASAPAAAAAAVAAGDALYASFDYEGALKEYQAGLAADSTSYDLWWRTARALVDRGARAEFDKDKPAAEAAFNDAVRAARRATTLSLDGWQGHEMLALSLGRLALFVGGKTKIRISKEVKAEADRSLALNPRADRTCHILGRWNRGIADLSIFEKAAAKVVYGGVPKGATLENAVAYFEKAAELNPNYANHHLELGKTYLRLDFKDKARAEFEKALACPRTTPFDKEYKDEAQARLSRLNI